MSEAQKPEKEAPSPAGAAKETPPAARPPETEQPSAKELTPEEQMERFAKELKETDWGHQPC